MRCWRTRRWRRRTPRRHWNGRAPGPCRLWCNIADAASLAQRRGQLLQALARLIGHDAGGALEFSRSGREACQRRASIGQDLGFFHVRNALLFRDLGGMKFDTRDRGDIHIGMSYRHKRVPNRRCKVSACDACLAAGHLMIVVVTDPDARHILAGEADEPGVFRPRAGAGFTDGVGEVQGGRSTRPLGHDFLQHEVHLLGDLARHHLRRWTFIAFARV